MQVKPARKTIERLFSDFEKDAKCLEVLVNQFLDLAYADCKKTGNRAYTELYLKAQNLVAITHYVLGHREDLQKLVLSFRSRKRWAFLSPLAEQAPLDKNFLPQISIDESY